MKATLHNAEQAAPDDLLTLELAYKHDPIVIALIRQVQEQYAIAKEESDTLWQKKKEIDGLQGRVAELEEIKRDMERGIDEAISGLGTIREFKKAEMIKNITEIMAELESLKDD